MIAKFTAWLIDLVVRGLKAVGDVFYDIAIWVLDGALSALSGLITAIPAPSFLSSYSLSSIFAMLPADVLFFVGKLGFGEMFALIGLGFAFRMARKVFTLGQW